ncbi:glycosyltransferase family 2 protein [Escherichia coli]|uniref:glycosyltransferase family 2 protein n=1 Tax=Escherichia coli TaxID=562 RepID=UPI00215704A0|nr:glycosyltransferase [Escherichia coli]
MLSLITVNYNSSKAISNLLSSFAITSAIGFDNIEFIIFDNYYSDSEINKLKGLEEQYSFVKVIYNKVNVGFAEGNNIASGYATNDYLFFVNPDCIFSVDVINEIFQLIRDNEDKPFFFPIIDENNKDVRYSFRFPFLSHYISNSKWRWYTGANLFILKDTFNFIGKWPEDYFMYSEDTDLHYNLLLKDINVKIAKSKIIHIGNASVCTVWNTLERERKVFSSMLKFSKKYNKQLDFILYYIGVSFSYFLKKPSYALLRLRAMNFRLNK